MKIIQHGRKPVFNTIQFKKFRCHYCSCVFEADKGEYRVWAQLNTLFYQCKCPDCGEYANEVVLRGGDA